MPCGLNAKLNTRHRVHVSIHKSRACVCSHDLFTNNFVNKPYFKLITRNKNQKSKINDIFKIQQNFLNI